MSGYGVPGIPGRSAGKDVDSARLDERKLDEAARHHEMGEEAKHEAPKDKASGGGFFRRLFRRDSSR